MTTQPEALRLASAFDHLKMTVKGGNYALAMESAAAELRRLHEANLDCIAWFEALKADYDAQQAVMRQALEYLEDLGRNRWGDRQALVAALRERLKQPQQEPVAWMHWLYGPVRLFMNKDEAMMELERLNREYPADKNARQMKPLYTTPPRREWVRLMRGVRVEDGTVIITVIGGNDNARLLCGELLREKSA